MRRLLPSVAGILLLVEGLSSGLRAATRLPTIVVYPWPTIAFAALRLFVAFQQFTAGWMVIGGRPPGPRLGRWAFAQSAVLVTLEIGLRFAPTNIFPSYRWWFVGAYWVYALAGILVLWRYAGGGPGLGLESGRADVD
jgi:hypothetical protein